MSYDIYLCDKLASKDNYYDHVLQLDFKHNIKGGTFAVGGTDKLHLNVTYNYSNYFYAHVDQKLGIRWLYGRQARDTVSKLNGAIATLEDLAKMYLEEPRDAENYWSPTPNNTIKALQDLLLLAKLCPEGVWYGD